MLIRTLIERASDRLTVMPGSGINELNIKQIRKETGAREFHLTAREKVESTMKYRKEGIFMGGLPDIPEYYMYVSDQDRIRKIVNLVNES